MSEKTYKYLGQSKVTRFPNDANGCPQCGQRIFISKDCGEPLFCLGDEYLDWFAIVPCTEFDSDKQAKCENCKIHVKIVNNKLLTKE